MVQGRNHEKTVRSSTVGLRCLLWAPPGMEAGLLEAGLLEAGLLEAGLLEVGLLEAGLLEAHWSRLESKGLVWKPVISWLKVNQWKSAHLRSTDLEDGTSFVRQHVFRRTSVRQNVRFVSVYREDVLVLADQTNRLVMA